QCESLHANPFGVVQVKQMFAIRLFGVAPNDGFAGSALQSHKLFAAYADLLRNLIIRNNDMIVGLSTRQRLLNRLYCIRLPTTANDPFRRRWRLFLVVLGNSLLRV